MVTHNGKKVPQLAKSIHNTTPAAVVNFPCISLPARDPRVGLPINMELCAPTGDDSKLIAIAKAVEKVISPMEFKE
jgi:Asp-tRNA(Asn)/Glu-tRNA(Gln) amidotransferase A subunit family amidase